MPVRVEVYSSLRRHLGPGAPPVVLTEAAGLTVAQMAARLGIPVEEVTLAFVNRRAAGIDRVLADGDLVGLFPLMDGG